MQIIIPMTGHGTRFKSKGYKRLKPFIKVHNRPMIQWVVKMFPGDEEKIIFVCQNKHLEKYNYIKKDLKKIAPKANIYGIKKWVKKGPVNDILNVSRLINDDEQVIISYCDFYIHWDYKKFKNKLKKINPEGSIPCYTGFHPHLLPEKNLYASCKVDKNNNLIEIKEKFSFEFDKTKALHSPGIYYFKTGKIMKDYFMKSMILNQRVEGEFYASLPFNLLKRDGLQVWCPNNVKKFCQWGTPYDLEQYLNWIKIIKDSKK